MRDGRIQQVDAPAAIYERPANVFVAGFVGTPSMNLLPAVRTAIGLRVGDQQIALPPDRRPRASDQDGRLVVGVRPEAFGAGTPSGLHAAMDPATREILGSETLVRGTIGNEPVTARLAGVVRDVPSRLTAPIEALHFFAADAAGTRL
jgi:multiple sugar transport system ATP-binding protein